MLSCRVNRENPTHPQAPQLEQHGDCVAGWNKAYEHWMISCYISELGQKRSIAGDHKEGQASATLCKFPASIKTPTSCFIPLTANRTLSKAVVSCDWLNGELRLAPYFSRPLLSIMRLLYWHFLTRNSFSIFSEKNVKCYNDSVEENTSILTI